ncbi:MAG: acyl-CoA dehydrogenase [Desulfobacula sp.]|nr:acyl-CoA dehydrogenase [Desulfobacula sp.]
MDILFSFEEKQIQKNVRKFTKIELLPNDRAIDETGKMSEKAEKKFKALMLLEAAFPPSGEDSVGSLTGLILALKEISYATMIPGWMLFENYLISYALFYFGSSGLKKRYFYDLCSLKATGALAFTEAETGSDPVQITTVAEKSGDGWIINGSKRFITNSGTCDYMILFAKTDDTITAFLIDSSKKGYEIGKRETFIQEHSIDNGEVYFKDYFCPDDHVIGELGQGFEILLKTEAVGKIAFSSLFLGIAKRALDLSIEFSKTRLHRGKPIGHKFQMIQGKIADIYTTYRAMDALLFQVSAKADKGMDIQCDAAVLKIFIAENIQKITTLAMEIHGAYGLSIEYDIERLYRTAISAQAIMGSMDIQRIIASRFVMSTPQNKR